MLSYIKAAEEQIDLAIAEAGDSPGTLDMLERAKSALLMVRWMREEVPNTPPEEIKRRFMETLDLMATQQRQFLNDLPLITDDDGQV